VEGEEGGLAISTASPFRLEGAAAWEGAEGARVLVRGAGELAFSYSKGPDEEGRWEWLDGWDPAETGQLPAAVRVEFTVAAEEGRGKTAFVVPIPAGGGLGG
jgi:hypothetical protein